MESAAVEGKTTKAMGVFLHLQKIDSSRGGDSARACSSPHWLIVDEMQFLVSILHRAKVPPFFFFVIPLLSLAGFTTPRLAA